MCIDVTMVMYIQAYHQMVGDVPGYASDINTHRAHHLEGVTIVVKLLKYTEFVPKYACINILIVLILLRVLVTIPPKIYRISTYHQYIFQHFKPVSMTTLFP